MDKQLDEKLNKKVVTKKTKKKVGKKRSKKKVTETVAETLDTEHVEPKEEMTSNLDAEVPVSEHAEGLPKYISPG